MNFSIYYYFFSIAVMLELPLMSHWWAALGT